MAYIPHEKLKIDWDQGDQSFHLSLPWMSMDVDVLNDEKPWIKDATTSLHLSPANSNVQKFLGALKDYPICYVEPRNLEAFDAQDLQPCEDIPVDTTTPAALMATFGCPLEGDLKDDVLPAWTWDWKKILDKARIPDTDLYDPLSFVSYLICYRLEWESTSWSGQDGFGQALEKLLQKDEKRFFEAIGWVAKQSWYVTTESCQAMEPALIHFEKARESIHHFICDETGHYKFMEQVFDDLGLDKDNFSVEAGTKWLLDAQRRTAVLSPLAFSALINLFEAAYYEGQDPISRVVRLSSKPHAAQGYDLHYKINQEHRHCDMPLHLAARLAPQTYAHAALTLGLFEQTLNFLDNMEKKLAQMFGV